MSEHHSIRTAQSTATDTRQAVAEFHAQVMQENVGCILFFCSSQYDLDVLAEEMNRRFAGIPVVGCTTAGEIGPAGYCSHSLSGASFPSDSFSVVVGLLQDLKCFEFASAHAFLQTQLKRLEMANPAATGDNSFAFMLIDGLSVREEAVASFLQTALGRIPLVGGSAGDDQRFSRTRIFHDGAFHSDCAALLLISTPFPFQPFKTQHFTRKDERLVVTEADPESRVVREINGLPAAREYARVIGVPLDDLKSFHFASSPVVVVIDGTDYVRSIQKVNPDGSLTFFCAIEEGLVLRVAQGIDLMNNLNAAFDSLSESLGPVQTVLTCDCILRNLEITQKGQKSRVGQVFQQHNAVGFSTYGEQYGGVHMNQTLTGIAIGSDIARR
ncbi:nitric oxide-sensing protein NosP [Propionivibrio dicarboxylicus]|uniref:Uncharacterized conserved protein, contains FIST_N domain n=1 Tax=Propionivibrio dicarboxylicus TaxID=83767 RepID=A0A1G8BFH9_9RHOO|nr:nitric oxide-sensing protein NosP [Propionivibrio dicarboxylicus]SDH32002.1 Uncharacterized conserved protein, contains FIST_N domain [Propionivibrio dicarboxylicus]